MESMRWVGVDVHAKESLAAVLDPATGEINTQRISGRPEEAVLEWLATVAPPFRAVYEAGPTGYGLVRRARERGLDVVVCAPGHILKNATDHIKVDKRDAVRLARLLSAGELRLVRVPEPDEEQLRDLVRSREDLRVDLTRIRNRIGKFLLHREIYAPQHTETWGVLHRKWLRGLVFDDSPQSSSLKMRCMLTTSW
jgi:transposase